MKTLKPIVRCFVIAALLVLSGCGESGDPRSINLTGTVTIDGIAIENGKISFTPDVTKGNKGPMGVAKIKGGVYDTTTLGGRGVIGGAYRVEIENFVNSFGDGEERPKGTRLIKNPIPKGHLEEWDIPTDSRQITKDFDIIVTKAEK